MLKGLLDTARNVGHDKKDDSASPLVKSSIIAERWKRNVNCGGLH